MPLPDAVLVSDLERSHPTRLWYLPTYMTIKDLREGSSAMVHKVAKYLPPRPGEAADIYALRQKKFSYTPVMSTAIREFVAKLVTSPLHVAGSSQAFWQEFRSSVDGHGQDEQDLLTEVFSTLLYYGSCYIAVDAPKLDYLPRSMAEDTGVTPFLRVFSPIDVINEAEDWYVTRQLRWVSEPLQKPKTLSRWTFFTKDEIVAYETEVSVVMDAITEYDQVARVYAQAGNWVMPSSKNALVPCVARYPHNLKIAPMVKLELPPELWTGNNVYLKQLQYTRIESSWADAGDIAGTVQRVFTPTPPSPTDDPSKLYSEPDYTDVKSSNAHILIGNGFSFVESSGGAIKNLTAQLDHIKQEINDIVSMGYKSAQHKKTGVAQSGTSKQVDMTLLEDSMRGYGKKVAQMYERALLMVAAMASQSTDVSVNGLDTYATNTLTEMTTTTVALMPYASQIPVTAMKLWISKLCSLLTGTVAAGDKEKIMKELEDLYSEGLDANNPAHIQTVMNALGVDQQTAQGVLSGTNTGTTSSNKTGV